MRRMSNAGFIILISVLVTSVCANITVVITTEEPQGLKFAVEDKGYRIVELHYTINRPMDGIDAGDVDVSISSKTGTDNYFVHENKTVVLAPNDVVFYWMQVIIKSTGKRVQELDMSYRYKGNTCIMPKCQYACHCYKKKCIPGKNGVCYSGFQCAKGYFGYGCQYVDLCDELQQDHPALNDRNVNTTFNGLLKEVSVRVNPSRFTFLHLVFTNSSYLHLLHATDILLFRDGITVPCARWSIIPVVYENDTVEYRCLNITKEINTVIIKSDQMLPLLSEVYISGGRNVAVLKNVSMTTADKSSGFEEDKAVDGKYGNGFIKNECVDLHTGSSSPILEITFDNTYLIDYFIIRNKPTDGVVGFILTTFNIHGVEMYRYEDKSERPQTVYKILHDFKYQVHKVKLTMPGTKNLTICELETYGDCPIGTTGLNCGESCSPECARNVCTIDGECVECSNNTHGIKCDKECPTNCKMACERGRGYCTDGCILGFSGFDCTQSCPSQCKVNTNCHQFTKQCLEGCPDGYSGAICNETCPSNCKANTCNQLTRHCNEGCIVRMSGAFCNETCSPNCLGDGSCNSKTGACIQGCKPGFWGDTCRNPDAACSNNCGGSKKCHHETGKCSEGCIAGYGGSNCSTDCSYCIDGLCDMSSLACTKGCKEGVKNTFCTTVAEDAPKGSNTIYVVLFVMLAACVLAFLGFLALRKFG